MLLWRTGAVDADNLQCDNSHIMRQAKPSTPLTDPLRQAIADSGLPLLTLEQETGVLRATIMRFMRGDTSLRLDKADALARFFGLELQPRSEKGVTSRRENLT